jgi:hypothetical protein
MADIAQPNQSNFSESMPAYPDNALAITKSDASTYPSGVFVYVGTAGDVAIVPFGSKAGSAVTFVGLSAGAMVPCRAYKVMSTNTTASNLVGVY